MYGKRLLIVEELPVFAPVVMSPSGCGASLRVRLRGNQGEGAEGDGQERWCMEGNH